MIKHEEKEMKAQKFAAGGVTKAKSTPTGKQMGMLGMKSGGMPMVMKGGKKMPAFAAKGASSKGSMMEAPMMKKGGMTKMSKGGGIESMGQAKGLMCLMKASRGMGAIALNKQPKTTKSAVLLKKGGGVNAAGNYTKPEVRKRIVSQVKAAATHGTGAGQWSARKAQLVAKKYKAAGGGYK